MSPADRAALANLHKMALLPLLIRKYTELSMGRIFYDWTSAESVRCSALQFPTVYRLMREACETLDVPEPELYIKYDFRYNASTAGVNMPYITLNSALVNSFSDDELLYIIGREIGHIKCGQVMYQELGRMLIPLLDAIGEVTLGMGKLAGKGLVAGFFEWLRQAEYSCDRAGMLACQSTQTAFTATMKLGCGSTRYNNEMNVDAFLAQARAHSDQAGLEGLTKALVFHLYTWNMDHPQVVYRAKKLDEWISSGAYHRIIAGEYQHETRSGGQPMRCKSCGSALASSAKFCMDCGNQVD